MAAALAQGALAVLLLFGGSPPAAPQLTMGNPIPYITASAGHVVVGPAQPSPSPAQMEPMRFAVLRVEEPEEPE